MLKERESSEDSPATPDECAGCGGRIQDRYYLLAVDRQWHGTCLRCCECRLPLDTELTCFSRDGNIYCKEDYYRWIDSWCCFERITNSASLVSVQSTPDCSFDGWDGIQFHTNEAWTETYEQDGNPVCSTGDRRLGVYRLFCVKRCARCGNGITANELVMRARDLVYHLTCFTCVACGTQLSKGDVFGMRDGLVYCRPHYDSACLDDFCDEDMTSVYRCQDLHSEGDSPTQYYNGGPIQKGRPRKRKLAQGSPDNMQVQTMRMASTALEILHRGDLSSSMESLAYDSSVASPGSVSSHTQRTKRMRTSFKHHQLRTMKSYFAINQNPDAKDLKQLAQKTGLSKRVLQVWFQNARAKWRRNMMRQESSNGLGHSNGSIIPGSVPQPSVGPSTMLLSEPMQNMEDMRVHTPHPHPMSFNELY